LLGECLGVDVGRFAHGSSGGGEWSHSRPWLCFMEID